MRFRYAEDAEEYADHLFHKHREMTEEEKLQLIEDRRPVPDTRYE